MGQLHGINNGEPILHVMKKFNVSVFILMLAIQNDKQHTIQCLYRKSCPN